MKVSRPLTITLPASGVYFAESEHALDFQMRPRADAYHKLLYVLRGRVTYREAEQPAEPVGERTLLLVPARVRHALADEVPSTLLLLCVADAVVRGDPELNALWAGGERVRRVSGSSRMAFEDCWRRALVEQSHARPASAAATRALALQVFVQVCRLPALAREESAAQRVAGVARAMTETFFERWSLDGAAERAGMSRRHFSAHFRAAHGRTFWEFLTELRLAHAAQLLRRGEHSIAGAVFACGFGDVSQFYRLFRARFGKAPGAWVQERGK